MLQPRQGGEGDFFFFSFQDKPPDLFWVFASLHNESEKNGTDRLRFVILVVAEAVPKGGAVGQGQRHIELARIPVCLQPALPAVNDVNKKDELRLLFNTLPSFRFRKPKNAICCGDESFCLRILVKMRSAASGCGETYVKASQIQDPILNR